MSKLYYKDYNSDEDDLEDLKLLWAIIWRLGMAYILIRLFIYVIATLVAKLS